MSQQLPPDDRLLGFPEDQVFDYTHEQGRALLAGSDADLYRNHLLIAWHLEGCAVRYVKMNDPYNSQDFERGYREALLNVCAYLRRGDYLPGGLHFNTAIDDVL